MQGVLYEEKSVLLFLLVTVAIGGGTAWLTGRALALTWRRQWQLPLYLLALGFMVRFVHYALFHGTLLSTRYFAVDYMVLLVFGYLGFRVMRARQMSGQYAFAFERTGPFGWKAR